MQVNVKKIIVTGIFFSLSIFYPSFAIQDITPDSILTMNDCIEIALKNSPKLKKDKYNYEVAGHNVSIAKSAFFPKIGVGTGYNLADTYASNANSNSSNYSVDTSLSMLIFNFGKTNANINAKKFNKINAFYTFRGDVLTTSIDVKKNYYGVLQARAAVDINNAYVEINERNYQRTKAYFEEGIKSKIDLVNAEVNLSDAKVLLVEAEKKYRNALVKLNNSMYIPYAPNYELQATENFDLKDKLYTVDLKELDKIEDLSILPKDVTDAKLTAHAEKKEMLSDYKFKPFPYSFEECVDMAYERRSIIKAYKATIDAMKETLKYVKREYYPDLTASTGYNFKTTNTANSFNVGVNLSSTVNILSKKHEIDNAKLQVKLAENELNLLKKDIYFSIQDAYVDMTNLEKQIPLLEVNVRQTLENFELADGRYSVGLGDYIELQNAKVRYNTAQHTFVEAIYKYNVCVATLEGLISAPQEVTISIEDVQ